MKIIKTQSSHKKPTKIFSDSDGFYLKVYILFKADIFCLKDDVFCKKSLTIKLLVKISLNNSIS